ncbi:MAG: response regulator [Candidatus Omnitrophica bacterium]|nr:response regulator [Candidatus Omnitrophota bacterium]
MECLFNKIFKKNNNIKNNGKVVLVVEDNEVDRSLIQKTLQKEGYKVILAENGAVGLKMAAECKPNLVLLDCEMPVMDGQEMCRRIKEDDVLCNIPVLFLTGLNTPRNIVECFDLDAENFLSKPVNPKILASHIRTVLEDAQSK